MELPSKIGGINVSLCHNSFSADKDSEWTWKDLSKFAQALQKVAEKNLEKEQTEKMKVKEKPQLVWEKDDLYKYTIAQDDDQDYDESGYICLVRDKTAYIGRYSHCSCYGTWTSLTGGGVSQAGVSQPCWSWIGTVPELKKLVKGKLDPCFPDRVANPEDYDYDHLMNLYKQLEEYFKK